MTYCLNCLSLGHVHLPQVNHVVDLVLSEIFQPLHYVRFLIVVRSTALFDIIWAFFRARRAFLACLARFFSLFL